MKKRMSLPDMRYEGTTTGSKLNPARTAFAGFHPKQRMRTATRGSLLFQGDNSRIVLTDVVPLQESLRGRGYTIEFFFFPTAQTSSIGTYQTVFDTQGNTSIPGFYLTFENTLVCQAYIGNNASDYRNIVSGIASITTKTKNSMGMITGTSIIKIDPQFLWGLNRWNHVAMTYTPTTGYTLYLNGYCHAIDNSTTAVALENWCSMWQFGCRKNSGNPDFGINNGYLQNFRVSNIVRYTGYEPRVSTYTVPSGPFIPDEFTVYLNTFDQSTGSTLSYSQIIPTTFLWSTTPIIITPTASPRSIIMTTTPTITTTTPTASPRSIIMTTTPTITTTTPTASPRWTTMTTTPTITTTTPTMTTFPQSTTIVPNTITTSSTHHLSIVSIVFIIVGVFIVCIMIVFRSQIWDFLTRAKK